METVRLLAARGVPETLPSLAQRSAEFQADEKATRTLEQKTCST
jgi:hypothetical protein